MKDSASNDKQDEGGAKCPTEPPIVERLSHGKKGTEKHSTARRKLLAPPLRSTEISFTELMF
jgi:hypothetical protein